jgi:hypothetical protein
MDIIIIIKILLLLMVHTLKLLSLVVDNNNTNHWVKVTNLTDNGGWYADTSDKKFYSAKCGKPKDYIMTNSGPDVFFRSDNMILDFKNLSIREIQAIPAVSSRSSL